MSYLDSINQALAFIENYLNNPIQIDDIAATTFYSKFHFQRLCSLILGETVRSYIRNGRLTEASKALIESDHSIIDIALDCHSNRRKSFLKIFNSGNRG